MGFVVPAYETWMLAGLPRRDDTISVLLSYWACVPLALVLVDNVPALAGAPLYWFLRMLVLLWLVEPRFGGSSGVKGAGGGRGEGHGEGPLLGRAFDGAA